MLLCALGHVATTAELARHGMTPADIRRLASNADVVRVTQRTFTCAHLTALERTAADAHARLDCISVLRENQIWVGDDRRLHVCVPPGARSPMIPNAIVHWRAAAGDGLRVPVVQALAQAMSCLPSDDVVAALESALHLKKITRREADQLVTDAPRRLRSVLTEVEPGAQSGPETHVRLRLRRAGYRVRSQVFVPGVGHVDNLIDDVLAIDTDGRAYHAETFEEDRRRDLGTEWMGIRTLRIPAMYVFTDWEWVSETVARMVRDGLAARGRPPSATTRG